MTVTFEECPIIFHCSATDGGRKFVMYGTEYSRRESCAAGRSSKAEAELLPEEGEFAQAARVGEVSHPGHG